METRQGVVVRKADMDVAQTKRIRAELRVRADWDPKGSYGPPPASFKVYGEDETSFFLPTFWARTFLGRDLPKSFRADGCPRLIFHGRLKPELNQPAAVEATMQAMRGQGGGILAVYTGGGKTCMALYAACQLKLKTLVVVNRTVLMQQWQERIAAFVPEARIGTIQGPTFDVDDKDIVVAMLQSLSQRQYDMTGFGLSIIDECNHIAAPTFSQAMLHINSPYRLGLSATPERKDGLTRVLLWFLGPIFCTMKRHDEHRVEVDVLPFDCAAFKSPPPTRNGKLDFNGMLEVICGNKERNDCIAARLAALPARRQTLVLSARRPHCENLAALLRRRGVAAMLYLGGMRQPDLEAAKEAPVIVATFSMAAEGLDIPTLNTLVLATPKSDVVQACGRVLRGVGGAVDPLIIDVRDSWGCASSQYYARRRYYREAGYRLPGDPISVSEKPACGFCS